MNVNGKNVVITGASSGIGYEILLKLLEKNCKVVAASRTISKTEIKNPNLYKFDCDLSSNENLDKLFEYAVSKLGKIDIFIANAGFAFYEKIGKADWKHIEKIYKCNVFNAIYSAEKMKEICGENPYNMVITASAMGYISLPGYALYSSTKSALRGFADAYRYELEKGQHLQLVYPIATKTKFFKAAGDIPVAWPLQEPSHVANKVINAIGNNKNHIHPSLIFRSFKYFSNICPPLVKIYNMSSNKSFKKWIATKENSEK